MHCNQKVQVGTFVKIKVDLLFKKVYIDTNVHIEFCKYMYGELDDIYGSTSNY